VGAEFCPRPSPPGDPRTVLRGRRVRPVYLVVLEVKIRIEERLMLAEFPEDYPRYRRHVPQLVPGLRLIGPRKVVSG
jgi:hypothetical protein